MKFMKPRLSLPTELKSQLGVTKVYQTFSGGQKYVFIADCKGVKRAIKLFRFGFGERDKRELEFYVNNSHLVGIPKIVEVIHSGKEVALVEEYVEGECLNDITDRYKRQSDAICQLIKDLVDIMTPIWKERKVHRDLKPLNIIIKSDRRPVILDFGILKDPKDSTITETGFQPNSWQFAAPEQYLGDKHSISYRTDFFSISVIAYFLYYQELPFGQTKDEIENQIKSGSLNWKFDKACKLNRLFQSVFSIDISQRPRNTKILMNLLNK